MIKLNLSFEERIVLKLIKNEKLTASEINTVSWDHVFKEASRQAVLLSVFAASKVYRSHIPQAIYDRWEKTQLMSVVSNMRAVQTQKDMIEITDRGGYPYIIMKGMSAAYYWPKPDRRAFGDCDFLIDPAQLSELETVFEAEGYRISGKDHHCHVILCDPNGGDLEMHFEINGIPGGVIGNTIRNYMYDALQQYSEVSLCDCTFRMPAPEMHFLILLLHLQEHMISTGIGLRHLLDIGYFVSKTQDAPFWEEKLLPFLKQIGLFVFAQTMVKTCAVYCGTDCPDWAAAADDQLCEAVINDIFESGNFGRKNALRARSGVMISYETKAGTSGGKYTNIIKKLHQRSVQLHPQLKKQPIKHLISDIKIGFGFFKQDILKDKKSMKAMAKYADERKAIYAQLKLFE